MSDDPFQDEREEPITNDDELFFRSFFTEYLLRLDEIKRGKASISDLFVKIALNDLEYLSTADTFKTFMGITNEHITNEKSIDLKFIKYHLEFVVKRFGKSSDALVIDSVSVKMKNYFMAKMTNKHKLDAVRADILDYAVPAPISPRLLKQHLFKTELRSVSLSDIKSYLDTLCQIGLLKRKGRSDLYGLKD